jgi:hypothetical protein
VNRLAVAAAVVCLAFAAAPAAGAGHTASGTVLVLGPSQVFSGDGADCEAFGGALRTAGGQNLDFSIGGVLTNGHLDAHDQAIVDTIKAGERDGAKVIVTLGYVDSQPLCGLAIPTYVTSASRVAAPTPTPVPTSTPPPTGPSAPPPIMHTATGTIAAISPGVALLQLGRNYCEAWHGAMRTTAGQTIDFYVETALTGDLQTTGLLPVDKAADQRAKALQQAWALRPRPPTTITYKGPVTACGFHLSAVVTAVKVKLPRHRVTGRVKRLSSARVRSGGCKLWTGLLAPRAGRRFRFAVQTRGVARALRRARKRHALTTVTYVVDAGIPCNPRVTIIVVRARLTSSARRRSAA